MKPQSNRNGRRWMPAALMILLIGLLAAGLWPRPIPVETAIVTEGPLRTHVQDEGKTRIRHRFLVSAPVAGQLRRIDYKAGAVISSTGQVLAVIDPPPPAMLDSRTRSIAEARLETARAQLEKARSRHLFSRKELARSEQLHESRTLSNQELEQSQWRETAAARELTEAESALRQAETELVEFGAPTQTDRPPIQIRAPSTGRILRVLEESSRLVTPGTPLLELGDPRDLEVLIEVLSRDGAAIQAGAPVELDQWGGAEPLQGIVRHVEPAAFTKLSALGVEEQRVYVVVDITTPAEQRSNLGDHFRVEGRIITWEIARTLKVPSGALFRHGNDWHAYVLSNNRAQLRTVKAGRTAGAETQILEGLQPGDELILYPSDRVKNGARITRVRI